MIYSKESRGEVPAACDAGRGTQIVAARLHMCLNRGCDGSNRNVGNCEKWLPKHHRPHPANC